MKLLLGFMNFEFSTSVELRKHHPRGRNVPRVENARKHRPRLELRRRGHRYQVLRVVLAAQQDLHAWTPRPANIEQKGE